MMTPADASIYELVKALYAIDPSAAEIVVGPVAVRFNRLPALPEGKQAPDAQRAEELEVEVKALRMRLSQVDPEGGGLY